MSGSKWDQLGNDTNYNKKKELRHVCQAVTTQLCQYGK